MNGEQLKMAGIELVSANNYSWMDQAISILSQVSFLEHEFTSEDIRNACLARGLPQPNHANAWGALFSRASKSGIITRVGFRKNKIPSAHMRLVAVWCRNRNNLPKD